ncbi:MAG: ABC transporter ATP-binding protein [Ruminiclostridium sp.]|nr:ABC transporter ATP-binding protein [Ruminiclostridium sp.]
MIHISNLVKYYGKICVLNDINLNISKGEMVAITGKSGSGKTTLLNIISCNIIYDSGEYLFNGKSSASLDLLNYRRNVMGYIMQNPIMMNNWSVEKNIMIGIDMFHIKRMQKINKFNEIVSTLKIENLVEKNVNQLSGGERQKIAIARTLIYPKQLLLADEPTGSMDSASANDIMNIFTELNKNGVTLIIVTHDMDVAKRCNRKIEISDGSIISDN